MKTIQSKIKFTKYRLGIVAVGVFAIIFFGYIYSLYPKGNSEIRVVDSQNKEKQYVMPKLSKIYSDTDYGFSLNVPEDFSMRKVVIDGITTIVFENIKNEGIQMNISKFDERELKVVRGIKIFDKEHIQNSLLDMQILEDQPVEIGSGYRGLAFKSNTDAFDGASREVWFVFRGNLYQISTYDRFDELLKEMFVTWNFK